jgi:hypothetical protein
MPCRACKSRPATPATGRTEELLDELRRGTNGAVSAAMRGRGMDYPLNYGVSVAEIRRAALPFAPDDGFARELYVRPERESRIAATYIADPRAVTAADAGFWAGGIVNVEMAGYVALLVGLSPVVQTIMEEWLRSKDELLRYAAIMSGARAVRNAGVGPQLDLRRLLPLLQPGTMLADRAIAAFTGRAWRNFPSSRPHLEPFFRDVAAAHPRLWDELDIERDLNH